VCVCVCLCVCLCVAAHPPTRLPAGNCTWVVALPPHPPNTSSHTHASSPHTPAQEACRAPLPPQPTGLPARRAAAQGCWGRHTTGIRALRSSARCTPSTAAAPDAAGLGAVGQGRAAGRGERGPAVPGGFAASPRCRRRQRVSAGCRQLLPKVHMQHRPACCVSVMVVCSRLCICVQALLIAGEDAGGCSSVQSAPRAQRHPHTASMDRVRAGSRGRWMDR